MKTASTILVVEDDRSLREAICERLRLHGFSTLDAADAQAFDAILSHSRPDLIVLDVMLPGEDGLSICRRLPQDAPPVLMLSALGEATDRIVGLEIGAADYLAKPFDPRELVARIRAILRRPAGTGATGPIDEGAALLFDGWRFEMADRRLRAPDGVEIPLTSSEYELLRAFAHRPGRLLSRDQLLDLSRGSDVDVADRSIDLAVSRLRRRFLAAGGPDPIETVRGAGYRFRAQVSRG